jgi:hypothetical protein
MPPTRYGAESSWISGRETFRGLTTPEALLKCLSDWPSMGQTYRTLTCKACEIPSLSLLSEVPGNPVTGAL